MATLLQHVKPWMQRSIVEFEARELDSLCADFAALLAPLETKPESSPTAPDDDVVMTALFGNAMQPPDSSRCVGKHPHSAWCYEIGKKGKLSPRYIGLYSISKRIGNVAYELKLPQELEAFHPVFHISMLKKYMRDPSLIIPTEDIGIKNSLSYEEIHVQILDHQVRKLRTKEVASVKVLWRNHFVEDATWEA
ncbi:hypothetical protein MTR67_017668 [Solanum verrucosum]|uniref:Tf2-1-like SH3-like domain-containing protein n=1 Tax=Solanum verrucosum TaxID=315347 RepID=A0AAF0QJK0_SOLVR|nr:hypothetical protein MTR67_017668 [Solanum verrucosum]